MFGLDERKRVTRLAGLIVGCRPLQFPNEKSLLAHRGQHSSMIGALRASLEKEAYAMIFDSFRGLIGAVRREDEDFSASVK